ncbi:DUF1850 domain-containing protein [Halogeometricum limi]|uniref:DUF1850 domain-containing protein n=1 Tax=Halogeometricum limi TaxID=555875 RepID=A0A1I6FQ51_9EURY|nr:DUF1850 domain-containing protein [Halogeometricum limi]SFR32069.1 hypothetical protein SAMN04488124_0055 [Halogeometricum limi]
MSGSLARRLAVVVVLVLVLAGAGAATTTDGRTLVVEDAETGETLLSTPVSEGTLVALEYTHSVEKTRVLDAYAVDGTNLTMTRMEFESYGAGLPARANVTVENGTFVFDPDGTYEELYVKPGRIAGHELHVGSETYDLVALSDARSVRLTVERRSALARALSFGATRL